MALRRNGAPKTRTAADADYLSPVSDRTTPAEASDSVETGPRHPPRTAPAEHEIRTRAYYLWEQAGHPEGDGVQFWLEAERELNTPR